MFCVLRCFLWRYLVLAHDCSFLFPPFWSHHCNHHHQQKKMLALPMSRSNNSLSPSGMLADVMKQALSGRCSLFVAAEHVFREKRETPPNFMNNLKPIIFFFRKQKRSSILDHAESTGFRRSNSTWARDLRYFSHFALTLVPAFKPKPPPLQGTTDYASGVRLEGYL